MESNKNGWSFDNARAIDMVTYLMALGHQPAKIRDNDFWYLSPFREEKTPSFKINRKINCWYDFGMGKGGNMIDFAMLYHNCTIGELMQILQGDFSFHRPQPGTWKPKPEEGKKITILEDFALRSKSLLHYISQRRIPLKIADKFCREIRYELYGKTYYAIGFKNDLGGFEIRNPYAKLSSSPKTLTTINNKAEVVIVFEGFFDFLSFKTLHFHLPEKAYDYIILNSLSFFEQARSNMESHKEIKLYLDNNTAGRNTTAYALSLSEKYIDESKLYKNHDDLNAWIMDFGKTG